MLATIAGPSSPTWTIVRLFALWKAALLLVAAGSALVGPAYDTSASLLLAPASNSSSSMFLARLSSWDVIYFVQQAQRGYVFEQEWAFGEGLPRIITRALRGLNAVGLLLNGGLQAIATVGVIVAHVSHLLSSLALYRLGALVLGDQHQALVAACLHVLSPAGLFLSAPYAEAGFSYMSFFGLYLFAVSQSSDAAYGGRLKKDGAVIVSGFLLGRATTFRTNGLLNGVPFAYAFCRDCLRFSSKPSLVGLRRVLVLGVAGLCIAAGSAWPQWVAYTRYCIEPLAEGLSRPEWCGQTIPSIYSFVQRTYWGTGLFQYWTISNAPLFLLAAPMLYILIRSGWDMVIASSGESAEGFKIAATGDMADLVKALAAAQMILAVMALTSYHVQIITRLSSGYPVWYWWLAQLLAGDKNAGGFGQGVVTFMVMYAAIQAVLFSSFLPPA
ncbi:hypothetical protein PpBr36_08514 [Pyricularia pennisetigena]|uniref:hypothetical protein n=1 Tax=Pyricularia pennisetigena TaxID=1578925 RepID=UPI00114EA038|nr:hypothetical protein PpBr36_08514 [Pyricularia pennisetigena]TLS24090.1 hypothetical protein PpBr36_08514 [Pyricularia pennisetigena]